MKVAIDVHSMQAHEKTGIWVYTQGIIEGLSKVAKDIDFYLLGMGLRVKPDDIVINVGANFRKIILPVPDRSFCGKPFLWNDVALPLFCKARKVDVFHQPAGHRLPSWGSFRKVITIHDLRSLYIDDFLPQDIEGLKYACREADVVIAISEFTRQGIIEHLKASEDKVITVYNGVSAIRRIEDEAVLTEVRQRYELHKPFLFSLGMVPRKNVRRLIEAFSRSKYAGDIELVLAGSHGGFLEQYKELAGALNIENCVKFLSRVSEGDLPALFSMSIGFVFVSLFEGFGLPVLEAQMCGTPVLASNVSALPEVLGRSAMFCNPYDVTDITRGIDSLVESEDLRKALVEQGYENVKRFSWDKTAEELIKIYKVVVNY